MAARKTWSPVRITTVEDVVADGRWEYFKNGRKLISRIAIGRPRPHPSGQDWYCPLLFENETTGWKAIYGVGAIDSLMNAMTFVRHRFHEFNPTPLEPKQTTARPPKKLPTKRSRKADS
jgi:hypothetical protein